MSRPLKHFTPPKRGQINAIIYSEFDNTLGPRIVEQVPTGFLSAEVFDSMSDFFIAGRDPCHKMTQLTLDGTLYLSYPVCIEDVKYYRNAFFFNVAFALTPTADDTTTYEQVLHKLACCLEVLELESEFLFKQRSDGLSNDLGFILKKIFFQLNEANDCGVAANDANKINLKIMPTFTDPPVIFDHEVPVRIQDIDSLVSKEWDLTIQEVLPFVDGVSYVKRIAQRTTSRNAVEPELAKKCIQQLAYHRLVLMIDIFQFSNVYVPTKRIGELYTNTTLQQACCKYIMLQKDQTTPEISFVFRLYAKLQRGVRLSLFCQTWRLIAKNIDPRRFITFGVVNGLIRRVHKYPIVRPKRMGTHAWGTTEAASSVSMDPITEENRYLIGWEWDMVSTDKSMRQTAYRDQGGTALPKNSIQFDGTHSYDEICCRIGKSYADLDADIRAAPECVVISR